MIPCTNPVTRSEAHYDYLIAALKEAGHDIPTEDELFQLFYLGSCDGPQWSDRNWTLQSRKRKRTPKPRVRLDSESRRLLVAYRTELVANTGRATTADLDSPLEFITIERHWRQIVAIQKFRESNR